MNENREIGGAEDRDAQRRTGTPPLTRRIVLNGDDRHVEATTVVELLTELGLAGAFVAVAVNRACVPRTTYGVTALKDGDEVEILAPMAGG